MKKVFLIIAVTAFMVSPFFMVPKASANVRWTAVITGHNECGNTTFIEVTYELDQYLRIVEVSRKVISNPNPCGPWSY